MLKDLISKYIEEINAARIEEFEDRAAEVEKFRIRFLGRKGVMNELFEQFKALPNDQKKEMGVALNNLKNAALAKVEEFKNFVEERAEAEDRHDLTLPTDFAQRLAPLLGVELSARPSGPRHAGHLLRSERGGQDGCGPAHPHLVSAGASDGDPQASHPHHRSW